MMIKLNSEKLNVHNEEIGNIIFVYRKK